MTGKRAALYLRVSTSRQAEHDLSIPDQRRQLVDYCGAKGWEIAQEFVEPGASGTGDKRREFQEMIAAACSPDRPFDLIVVHSYSRFFRDTYLFEFYRRKLEKKGVELVSITQATADNPAGHMVRQIFSVFDEYQSRENAKHVARAMLENARCGFWNGSRPPFGYRTVEAERRGDAIKKRLEVDDTEAEVVWLIYRLYLEGDGKGPLGIKGIADYLNRKGIGNRQSKHFSKGHIEDILKRETYTGCHYYNKTDSRTRKPRPREEWIPVQVPPIIDKTTFERVQRALGERSPAKVPPRIVNGPTMLTGLLRCGSCGGGMTLRTGKGGKYRYYACSNAMRKGRTACKGRSIRMEILDEFILCQLENKLFTPERLKAVLKELIVASASSERQRRKGRLALDRRLRDVRHQRNRLYEAIEGGFVQLDDTLRQRDSELRSKEEEILRLRAHAERRRLAPRLKLTEDKLSDFAHSMHKRLRSPEPRFRKALLSQFVERIEVGDNEIRMVGSTATLAGALAASRQARQGEVPSFNREWWAERDKSGHGVLLVSLPCPNVCFQG